MRDAARVRLAEHTSAGFGSGIEQIERILLSHPAVSQAWIVPVEDAEFGQRPVALLERAGETSLESIARWAADKLATFQQPVQWFDLPADVSAGGIKLARRTLIDWVNQQREQPR